MLKTKMNYVYILCWTETFWFHLSQCLKLKVNYTSKFADFWT